MTENRLDPRFVRTRKLIMDAFLLLAMKKDLKDISIKDITTEATVNRATFYYHFMDKYDLLEKTLKESLMMSVMREISIHDQLNEKTIASVFMSLTVFLSSLASQCRKSFESFTSVIEAIIKKELEQVFYDMLMKQNAGIGEDEESVRIAAVMLSWSLYGAAVNWQYNGAKPAEEYIQLVLPYLSQGLQLFIAEEVR
ncbi:TetR/AcrR family transcriptional regulator [Paenibacillus sp. Leaf72]|uniref:TetR/AcrR family transcriptional regulator n=1 Tax=Paenibacillus sp. Leaf72 TaxID=1736234 RepID=UPI0006F4303F|nr:TetR/AcrR family transcriptional regulator [Paenibacillus sp. Leaf72]KQO04647.1 TetR family transcriptional regulator [Paenibacillus sp. Leaf72]